MWCRSLYSAFWLFFRGCPCVFLSWSTLPCPLVHLPSDQPSFSSAFYWEIETMGLPRGLEKSVLPSLPKPDIFSSWCFSGGELLAGGFWAWATFFFTSSLFLRFRKTLDHFWSGWPPNSDAGIAVLAAVPSLVVSRDRLSGLRWPSEDRIWPYSQLVCCANNVPSCLPLPLFLSFLVCYSVGEHGSSTFWALNPPKLFPCSRWVVSLPPAGNACLRKTQACLR